jgi:hypothetical protein
MGFSLSGSQLKDFLTVIDYFNLLYMYSAHKISPSTDKNEKHMNLHLI